MRLFAFFVLFLSALPAYAQTDTDGLTLAPATTTIVTTTVAPAVAPSAAPPAEMMVIGTTREVRMYGDVKRSFLFHMPKRVPTGLLSLVIVLPGEGMGATAMEQLTQFSGLSDEQGFVVAYPEVSSDDKHWNLNADDKGAYDLKFIQDIVDFASSKAPISPRTIFATGISNGAQMAARIACRLPEQFAAFALVAGNYPQWSDCVKRPVSLMMLHGDADQIMPYAGKALQMGSVGYAERMAAQNQCPGVAEPAFKEGDASASGWGNCAAKTEVVMFTFAGKGHSWPGSAMPPEITSQVINASALIWQFFKTHPLLPARATYPEGEQLR